MRLRLKNPPKSAEDYLNTLRMHGLTETVHELVPFIRFL